MKHRPQNNPETIKGRITLYLGRELKNDVTRLAKERGNTVSGLVRAMLNKWIKSGRI